MSFETELVEIRRLYPGLNFLNEGGKQTLKGVFDFYALYDFIGDRFILNPAGEEISNERLIRDSYEIQVEFASDYSSSFPCVREIGGRIEKIVDKFGISDIRDLHVNKNQNNSLCICPKPEEYLRYPNGVDLVDFFNALVLPYFYGLSYYEKNRQWPRNEYGHGDSGIFEFYAERRKEKDARLAVACVKSLSEKVAKEYLKKKGDIKGHWQCICGSGKRIRSCHTKAWEGLKLLKKDIN